MIRTDEGLKSALRRLAQDDESVRLQREKFVKMGLSPDQVDKALEPLVVFRQQLQDEVDWYEQARRGDLRPVRSLESVGRQLIALRIARGWSQRQLSEALEIDESQVSRDERNEYHGITTTRAQKIIDALNGETDLQVSLGREREAMAV